MNSLKIFNFEGNNVRTVDIEGKTYFVAKDVAKILQYSSTANAVSNHVPDKYKGVTELMTPGGKQKVVVINEAGLYKLVFHSKMPQAEQFTDWIAETVLPSIREKGVYMTNQKAFDLTHNPGALGDLLLQAGEQLKMKDAQISELTPKALFAEQIAKSHDTILIRDLAKLLYKNGIAIGQKELFRWMLEKDYLIKKHNGYTPTQKSVQLGILELRETPVLHRYTSPTINFTTLVTTKGQQYFIKKFLAVNKEIETQK